MEFMTEPSASQLGLSALDCSGLPHREPPPLGYFAETIRDAMGPNGECDD